MLKTGQKRVVQPRTAATEKFSQTSLGKKKELGNVEGLAKDWLKRFQK